jgi:hypothetical protein
MKIGPFIIYEVMVIYILTATPVLAKTLKKTMAHISKTVGPIELKLEILAFSATTTIYTNCYENLRGWGLAQW